MGFFWPRIFLFLLLMMNFFLTGVDFELTGSMVDALRRAL